MEGNKRIQCQNQTQVAIGGKGVKGVTKDQGCYWNAKSERVDSAFGDEPCHATKKNATIRKRDISLNLDLPFKGENMTHQLCA